MPAAAAELRRRRRGRTRGGAGLVATLGKLASPRPLLLLLLLLAWPPEPVGGAQLVRRDHQPVINGGLWGAGRPAGANKAAGGRRERHDKRPPRDSGAQGPSSPLAAGHQNPPGTAVAGPQAPSLSLVAPQPNSKLQIQEQNFQRRLMELKQKYMTRAISDRAYYILLLIYSLFILLGTISNSLICLTVSVASSQGQCAAQPKPHWNNQA